MRGRCIGIGEHFRRPEGAKGKGVILLYPPSYRENRTHTTEFTGKIMK